jgi:sulfoxide reductase heme-binding subunit YedZ
MKRLGKWWQRLHWLAYAAILLAVFHFSLQAKVAGREPAIYATIVVVLLLLRLPGITTIVSKPQIWVKNKLRNRTAKDGA